MPNDPLAGLTLPDDSTRPAAPQLNDVTPAQRMAGRNLRLFHNHHRQNMQAIRSLMAQIQSGEADAATLEAATAPLGELSENYRRFGALCGQHCHMIHGHHSIEDAYVFATLSEKAKAFSAVVDRLKQEHEIVHELLLRLLEALNALYHDANRETFAIAQTLYDALERLLLSHFTYEEDSIGDALGVYEIGV